MILIRTPSVNRIQPFNANENHVVNFTYSGTEQIIAHNVVIERINDSEEVYNVTTNGFALKHIIPKNTLVNGVKYRIKVKLSSVNNIWSEYSPFVIFMVLDNPIITFEEIVNNIISNQSYNFSATYSHPNDELLQSYNYILMDKVGNVIKVFPTVFTDGSNPLEQLITDFQNDNDYQIQINLNTVNGQTFQSEKLMFRVVYYSAKINALVEPVMLNCEGSIQVNIIAKRVLFKLYDENNEVILDEDIEYVGNEKLDLNRPDYLRLEVGEGFSSNENFVLQIWFENIPEDEVLMTLYSPSGYSEIVYYNDRFHCFKHYYNNNIQSHFSSNDITFDSNEQVVLYIKSENGKIDMVSEVVNI